MSCHTKIRCAGLLALLGCLSSPLSAENLLEVFQIALENDPTYLGEIARQRSNLEATPGAIADMLPSIRLAHNITREHSGLIGSTGRPLPNPHVQQFAVSLSQPIIHLDQWASYKSATYQVKSAHASLEFAIQDLIFRVSRAYFDVLSAQDNYNFSRTENAFIGKQLEQSKRRFEVGMIPITDFNDSQARFDNSTARVIDNKNKVNDAKQKLMEITGQPVEVNALNLSMPMSSPEPLDESQWIRSALENNLKIKASDFTAVAAKHTVNRRRAGHLPTLSLDSTMSRGNSSTQDSNYTARTATLSVSLPLFEGGSVFSQTRSALATYDRSLQDAQKDKRTATSQAHQSFQGMLTQIDRSQALAKAIVSNRSSLSATRAAYEIGARTITDVFEAQSTLFASQRDHSSSRYQYILASLQLKLAAGRLSPNDLHIVSQWLPEKPVKDPLTEAS